MRLNRLDLSRYGKFTDKRLDFGPARPGLADFHLVYGPNEAGKSTLFSAYLDLLFGIETQSGYGFLHPYPTMRVGGDVTIGAERHEVARLKRRQGSLVAPDDRPLPDALFAPALGGMDRQAYQLMFSLDDDSIERGGESILKSEGELGALLFSASSGLSGVGSGLERLRAEADAFFRPQGRKHQLSAMKAEIEELKRKRQEVDVAAREYGALTRQLEASTAAYDEAFQKRSEARRQLDEIERKLAAMPLLHRLRALRAQLDAYELGETPPREWAATANQLMLQEAELAARRESLQAEFEQRCESLKGIPADPPVLLLEAGIEDLAGSDLEARYRTARIDLDGRIGERERIDADIVEKRVLLAIPSDMDTSSLVLPADRAEALSGLAASRSGIDERLAAAGREQEEAVRALAVAEEKAEHAGASDEAPDGDAAREGLTRLIRLGRQNAARLREAERDVTAARKASSSALANLQWRGDLEALRALDAPGRETIDALRQAIRRHIDTVAQIGEQTRLTERDLAGRRAGMERMRRSEPLIADDEAEALRARRDEAWQAHRAALDATSAHHFEMAMLDDDRAGAQRLAQAGRLSELRLAEKVIAEGEARLEALQDELRRVASDGVAAIARTEAIVARCGLPVAFSHLTRGASAARRAGRLATASLGAAAVSRPDDSADEEPDAVAGALETALGELERIERWLERRAVALADAELASGRQAGLDLAEREARGLADRLAAALGARAPDTISAAVLDELLDLAQERADALAESTARRQAAAEAHRLAKQRLAERTVALKAAHAAIEDWRAAWAAAGEGTWLAAAGLAGEAARVGERLPLIHALSRLVEARRELDRRIDGMRRDEADYRRRATELAAQAGDEPAADPLGIVKALSERLQRARDMQARRKDLEAELDRLEKERIALEERSAFHDQRSRDICVALGCETLSEASFALERYREREDLRQRVDDTAHDLARQMLAASAEEAEAALIATDEAELLAEKDRLRAVHEDRDAEVREVHAARIKAKEQLAAIGADGTAAMLEERRRTLIMDLAERARGYLSTRAGILATEAALRLYRERHRSAMMRHASDAFRTISGGEYAGLATIVEKEQEILVATAAAGGTKLARELSKGTRFQLYLALRVAGYHEIAANREILPFVADDIMETFDDGRSLNTFRLMAEMSKVGQVIYLTHHQHLRDIAREACPDVVIHAL
ncbi:AAA domain-containing protein [Rhizobium subbaraonis]|uniref:AAA domain-containing protein n=1 Tax=Rhizobium subbaraonis TaxID=908946 RepID=A0A285UH04_9HYPH|nr:AAA family ATPase [Rhizobium subbaraonis]SOC39541.1 AAA domain-containing protein [Rhizobium subbaraonis]